MQKIFKWLMILLIAAVCGLLLFRIYTVNHFPRNATETVVTERLVGLYAKSGKLSAVTWEIPINYDDPQAPNFFCAAPVYFPEVNTFEITLRCKLKDASSLGFDENGSAVAVLTDDAGNQITARQSAYATGYGLYAYRRFVFEDVDLTNCNYLAVNIYPSGDENTPPAGRLAVYESRYVQKEYKLSARERVKLQNATREG